MKGFFRSMGCAAGAAIGYLLGVKVWNKVTNPVERNKIKKKVIRVKNAILKKEED